MTLKDLKTPALCLLLTLICCSSFYFYQKHEQKKTAVVDAVRLFNAYNMKKELETGSKVKLEQIGKQMDSLEQAFKATQVSQNDEERESLATRYQQMKMQLDQEFAASNQQINEEVWKRLNPLLQEYGKTKGFHVIIGANGMGSILYYDQYYDVTDDVIHYVNSRYEQP